MAWWERDYYRQESDSPAAAALQLHSWVAWIIVVNVVVFLIDPLLGRLWGPHYLITPMGSMPMDPLQAWGHFSVATTLEDFQLWRLLTFQFLHQGLFHIFFNMLVLYFFGPMVEAYLGPRRFLAFYLICGVAGPLAFLIFWAAGILGSAAWVPMVGASAGIFGVLIAGARIAPNVRVMLLIPPIPMSLRTMVWVFLAIALYSVFSAGGNAGGEAAHLGGAAMGWFLIRNPRLLNFVRPRQRVGYWQQHREGWS